MIVEQHQFARSSQLPTSESRTLSPQDRGRYSTGATNGDNSNNNGLGSSGYYDGYNDGYRVGLKFLGGIFTTIRPDSEQ